MPTGGSAQVDNNQVEEDGLELELLQAEIEVHDIENSGSIYSIPIIPCIAMYSYTHFIHTICNMYTIISLDTPLTAAYLFITYHTSHTTHTHPDIHPALTQTTSTHIRVHSYNIVTIALIP